MHEGKATMDKVTTENQIFVKILRSFAASWQDGMK